MATDRRVWTPRACTGAGVVLRDRVETPRQTGVIAVQLALRAGQIVALAVTVSSPVSGQEAQ